MMMQAADAAVVVLNLWTDEEGEKATCARLKRVLRKLHLLSEKVVAVLDDRTLDVTAEEMPPPAQEEQTATAPGQRPRRKELGELI